MEEKKLLVLPAALDKEHPLHIGYVKKEERKPTLEDLVYIPVKCYDCKKEGQVPTLRQILDKEDTPLRKMLDELGYVPITCGCKEEATE